ncbi:MAG: sterol desaturase family protein [Bdellovibrionales bacterium]
MAAMYLSSADIGLFKNAFSFWAGTYFLAGVAAALAIRWLHDSGVFRRRIQDRWPDHSHSFDDALRALRSVTIFAIVAAVASHMVMIGTIDYKPATFESAPWQHIGHFVLLWVGHDTYFYWLHRAMHHPRLISILHSKHHESHTPMALSAFSFTATEAFLQAIFFLLWAWAIPASLDIMDAFLLLMIASSLLGHCGMEFYPRWLRRIDIFNTAANHDFHHRGGVNSNFGLYFTFWDKLMGTYVQRMPEEYQQKTPD